MDPNQYQQNQNYPPQNFSGQPQDYSAQMQDFGGQPQNYSAQMQDFSGQPQNYSAQMQDFGGQPQNFSGQPQNYSAQMQGGGIPKKKGTTGLVIAISAAAVALIAVAVVLIVVLTKNDTSTPSTEHTDATTIGVLTTGVEKPTADTTETSGTTDATEATTEATTAATTEATTETTTAATTEATTVATTEATTEATTAATTEATTAATTEATTAATTEAPLPKAYGEEHDYTWTDPYGGLELPAYSYCQDENGNPIPQECGYASQNPVRYVFGDIQASEPDIYGYVSIRVPVTVVSDTFYTYVKSPWASYCDCNFSVFKVSDYYSGMVLDYPEWDRETANYVQERKKTDVTWNGQTYTLYMSVSKTFTYGGDGDNSFDQVDVLQDGSIVYELYEEEHYAYEFYVPADYDGLVLSLPRAGYTKERFEAKEINSDSPKYCLGPDSCGWTFQQEDLHLIRVSDNLRN